jgi:hypothetical protein
MRTAAELFTRFGPIGQSPQPWMFATAPTSTDWRTQLAGQTRIAVGPEEALMAVPEAWTRTTSHDH